MMSNLFTKNRILGTLVLGLSFIQGTLLRAETEVSCEFVLDSLKLSAKAINPQLDPKPEVKTQKDVPLQYQYVNYHGPVNSVLKAFLNEAAESRSPILANVLQHGKVFQFIEVLTALNLYIESESNNVAVSSFVDKSDPMRFVTPRANYLKKSISKYERRIALWLLEQYPELKVQVELWIKSTQVKNDGMISPMDMKVIDAWLNAHPAYKQGLIIFPKPGLWNRIGNIAKELENKSEWDKKNLFDNAISSGREYKIETVAALFNPELAEKNFEDLYSLLRTVAGPYSTRLTQQGVVKKIAEWILTQYPELSNITQLPKYQLDPDALTHLYGRTLGVIPIEWATGDLTQIMSENLNLAAASKAWQQKVLPKILAFIRGDLKPQIEPKQFLLKDNVNQQRRALRSGDFVKLAFRSYEERNGQDSYLPLDEVAGLIKSTIIRNGIVVGIEVNLVLRAEPGSPNKPVIGYTTKTFTYWLSDFEVEDSVI